MVKNIFIAGLDDFHLSQLNSLRDADHYNFHSLISYKKIKCGETFPVRDFVKQACRKLGDFRGQVDGVVGFWDFPVSTVLPYIRQQVGLDGPSLISVLKCEHKYWSRLQQAEVVPQMIPPFRKINPFSEKDEKQLDLEFPFWIKPVKSVLSHLGFLIRDRVDLKESLQVIRENIGRYADPFNYIMSLADLPAEIKEVDGYHCIAEGIISEGHQCTLEGYVHNGEVHVYGVIDSVRGGRNKSSFSRYQYPSSLPLNVQQRMIEATEKVLHHMKYDNSPFNIEFYWNQAQDTIYLLEINTRISKSHCPLFKMVDGEFHHAVMIDVATGRKPDFPVREGEFSVAAKFMMRRYQDGNVYRVPHPDEIAGLKKAIPGTEVVISVKRGMRLSDLRDQDSYSYEIGDLFIGADSERELQKKYQVALSMLPFGIELNNEIAA